ncbi:molybdopterin molybdotransferase MoeA [Tindallia californiensis]|uniref:Molybdopterin molybdenumtransferase n=1 Tax=Tindallia californiensis TaxID=159292 RepID=A0A1H3IEW2_9FIRM|nr:gephyrin-like molybdotransferase Glp [Tindallia californiensis]SDY26117.1 molybdopterin molybdochelatase [Tindallia californiensis]
MELFKTKSIHEVQEILKNLSLDISLESEEVALVEGLHRPLCNSVESPMDIPEFNRSTVDGYAVKATDTHGANESIPAMLKNIGEIEMGTNTSVEINAGECVYVPTGGMIPEGSDAVVMIECVEVMDNELVLVHQSVAAGENTLLKGEDMKKREMIFDKGHRLRPQDVGLLAGMGFQSVHVYGKLKVGIISTGDEIVQPGDELTMGKIIDMNSYSISAAALEDGCEVVDTSVVPDDIEILKEKLRMMMKKCHLILVSGGSSMGHRDVTKDAINSIGDPGVVVHGISVKPGKPTIIGKVGDTLMIGLPGQPVSALVVYRILINIIMEALVGSGSQMSTTNGKLAVNIPSAPGREHYVMVRLDREKTENVVQPVHGKSGMLSMMSKADGFVKIDANKEGLNKGTDVMIYLF